KGWWRGTRGGWKSTALWGGAASSSCVSRWFLLRRSHRPSISWRSASSRARDCRRTGIPWWGRSLPASAPSPRTTEWNLGPDGGAPARCRLDVETPSDHLHALSHTEQPQSQDRSGCQPTLHVEGLPVVMDLHANEGPCLVNA